MMALASLHEDKRNQMYINHTGRSWSHVLQTQEADGIFHSNEQKSYGDA